MRLFLRLAWRNIWRQRRRTLIVVLAIGLTTAMMLLYDGMIDGFYEAIYGNAVKVLGGNIHVHAPGYEADPASFPMLPIANDTYVVDAARSSPKVVAATRRINTGGMVTSREGAFAVGIVGIEPEAELPVSFVGQRVTQGRNLSADDRDAALIGKALAEAMEVTVGDRMTVVGRTSHNQMRQRTMTAVGVYDLGMAEIEKSTIYISLAAAQSLYLAPGQATEVVIWLDDLAQGPEALKLLAPAMTAYEMTTWRESWPELTRAMAADRATMEIFGMIMMVIAGIGTLNLMLMAVYERTREIGVLGALGLKPRQISALFLLEGSMMGLVGGLAGVGLGLAVNAYLGQVGYDFTQFTSMTEIFALIDGRIYSSLALGKAPRHVLTAMLISILASYYPAREAARREPAAALHYV